MQVTVRYFASVREALGASQALDVAEGLTVGGLRDLLIASSPRHAEVLARGRAVRAALNQTMCDESAALSPDAEVAFFPPVTGG
ncbi:MAG: molybdopterin converting factor subunit 1 [Aquabacterium sp.]|jgi:molybdopterin synthase sulfur carrier subunit|nr:MAG: molybdopterin converting factor subunit 1 [Aquabacterium sp.]TAL18270.1 MAG: molybdopterin converting factor subunit 1 [Aquabacterium sp.]